MNKNKIRHIYVVQCLVDNKINFLPITLNFSLGCIKGDFVNGYKKMIKAALIRQYYGLYADNVDVIDVVYYHYINGNEMEV